MLTHDQLLPDDPSTLAQRLAQWAETLRGCTASGLRYAPTIYDRDNYETIQRITLEMFAVASGRPYADIEPLRATLFTNPSPLPVSDAAVIDEHTRILLVRRADNQLWAMPGGALAAGETAADGAVREALEETGVTCTPVSLIAVHDSRFCGTLSPQHLYHFLFLCRPSAVARVDPPTHAHEVVEMNWFSEHMLPQDIDPGHIQRIPEAFRAAGGETHTYFDYTNA